MVFYQGINFFPVDGVGTRQPPLPLEFSGVGGLGIEKIGNGSIRTIALKDCRRKIVADGSIGSIRCREKVDDSL